MKDEFINSLICIAEKINLGLLFMQQTETKDNWKIITLNKPFFKYFNHPFSNSEGQFFSDSWVSSIPEITLEVNNFSFQKKNKIFEKTISFDSIRKTLKICFNKNTMLFTLTTDMESKGYSNNTIDKELFQTLLNHSPDLIYFKDKEARFVKNSKSHCDFLGVSQEELIGKTDLDVFKEGIAEQKYKDDLNVINSGISIINKEEADVTAKKHRWVTSTKLPIKDKNDNIIGLFGISRDITEKREAQLKIKKLNDNFQTLISTSLGFQQTAKINNLFTIAGNLIINKFEATQLIFLYKNPTNEKYDIFRYPCIRISSTSSYRTIIEYILSNSSFYSENFTNERITIDLDEFFQRKAIKGFKELEYKHASLYQLKEKNEPLGYALIFRNIEFEDYNILFLKVLFNKLALAIARINLVEKLKLSIQKAEESDRLKTVFLNNISHEVRTPLNGIIGYSQLLNGRVGNEDAKLNSYAENVVSNAKILLDIFEDLIEISKLESGKISIIQQETIINELIDSLAFYLEEQLKRYKKTDIKTEYIKPLPPEKLMFHIDATRVLQVLKALVSNAVKFTDKGNIRIGYLVDSSNKDIKFFVEDTGMGITKKVSDIIFNLFRQGDESSTRKHGGIGVGLSIANALAKNLGGKITFKTKPNEGSTFFFTLPV